VEDYVESKDALWWRYPGLAAAAALLAGLGFAVHNYFAQR
jgi:hypothetical protein